MAAPFDSNGRYSGGISLVANEIANAADILSENKITLIKFETCRRKRQKESTGRFSLSNVLNTLQVYFALPREIKSSDADILYFHTSVKFSLLKDLFVIRHAKAVTGIKTVLHIHFADYHKIITGKRFLDRLMLRWIQRFVDHTVFLSLATMAEFIARGVDEKNCSVIYNFCNLNISEKQINEKLSKNREITKFLFVGTISGRKGIFNALRCLREIDEPFEIHVCGVPIDKVTEEFFDKYRNAMGNKLIYHGYLSGTDKADVYYNSDVLLLPSYGEGMPIVILEAYAAGCAVITTTVGAIPEIVNEKNGMLVTPGDRAQLHQALSSYLKMPNDKLKEIQKHNYAVGKNYSIETFIKNISDICDQLL